MSTNENLFTSFFTKIIVVMQEYTANDLVANKLRGVIEKNWSTKKCITQWPRLCCTITSNRSFSGYISSWLEMIFISIAFSSQGALCTSLKSELADFFTRISFRLVGKTTSTVQQKFQTQTKFVKVNRSRQTIETKANEPKQSNTLNFPCLW